MRRSDGVQNLQTLGDDLGADPVTRDDGQADAAGSHARTLLQTSQFLSIGLTLRDARLVSGSPPGASQGGAAPAQRGYEWGAAPCSVEEGGRRPGEGRSRPGQPQDVPLTA
ncbi:hypothetical protein GCM10022214_24810 [Actinomadura miaoliensis]|uniref:Uncharacterized protein n=1 Tax=Actinomadura miaoliensis TaxID=430685 RepID=A0ABP7VJX2_9ACTN